MAHLGVVSRAVGDLDIIEELALVSLLRGTDIYSVEFYHTKGVQKRDTSNTANTQSGGVLECRTTDHRGPFQWGPMTRPLSSGMLKRAKSYEPYTVILIQLAHFLVQTHPMQLLKSLWKASGFLSRAKNNYGSLASTAPSHALLHVVVY
ncbi:hypothetical protein N7504_001814 [Penicillium tannophilum]|nr:hypothetical protein N7504_001814 [Penicillium tannophilum]